MTNYDIIGDIHGHADALEQLLQKMGYRRHQGIYQNPSRKVVFLGDFIDRGPKIRETLHLVKDMVDAGFAHAIMGNHEYNAVCFATPNSQKGGFFREHTIKEIGQHEQTLKQFKHFQEEWRDFLTWFKHLPMFLEFPNFNVVHAYWNAQHIAWLKAHYHPESGGLSEAFLFQCSEEGDALNPNVAYTAVEETLKGAEMRLPDNAFMVDKEGNIRYECRLKWWAKTKGTMGEGLMECPDSIKSQPMPEKYRAIFTSDKPIFFGHYWLKGTPEEVNPSAICLDYSIAKDGKLTAYQFDQKQFVWV